MVHDRLSGRISHDSERGVVLVIDGIPLDMDDLASILASREGSGFEMHIIDALE
jgi:hypothetical protein